MDESLLADVYERLDVADLPPVLASYVMAACEGQLAEVLGGAMVSRSIPEHADLPDPVGAYLSEITVEGFRGIGPRRTLPLNPGPGLTVVVGRNGSGKSSFAEAVEVVLTGTSSRWDSAQSKSWTEGWRNLHAGTPSLHLEILEESATTPTRLVRQWSDPEDLTTGDTTARRAGNDPEPLDVLGWSDAISRHRPILSYHELGTMLQGVPQRSMMRCPASSAWAT
ncbi:MAG: ATP-binding protein [Actinomycetota bacterium]|uniref:AAA family ATPase n=1 Tax=Euzebya rosea TaxID=2052804 RepID=UPI0013006F0C|nr:ATP-binding protein [Euzebya rosea]